FNLHASFVKDSLIVKMKKGEALIHHSLIKSSRNLFDGVHVIKTDQLIKLEQELKDDPRIEYTQRNYRAQKRVLPETYLCKELEDFKNEASSPFNDPKVSQVWSFKNAEEHGISVNYAYQAYPIEEQEEIIVAVVDTGVDVTHEDLKDVMWKNPGEIPGNKIDDDENGYVDDINGINTLVRDSEERATGTITDTSSHGTHVSGTIAAKQNNNKGIAGIASHAKIMGIKTVPRSGDETDVNVVESFIYAAKNGARIINCSFGKRDNEGGMAVSDAIKYIGENYGVLVIAAAGNDHRDLDENPMYPAAFDNEHLLVVASTYTSGTLSFFSNYGIEGVDVAAPGSDIFSTTPNNRYGTKSGTSMASPTTAGLAAEILSRFPELTPLELKETIMSTVTPVEKFQDIIQSGGRVNLYNALNSLYQ
ncbi:MAG: S8 family peptidase, partial [Nanoarchaeota archaeon]